MSKSIKLKNDNYWDSTSIVHKKKLLSDVLGEKQINITSITWTYNTSIKFFTLPYSSGTHSYIITGVVSYVETDLYSNVMLLVTQTNNKVKIDRIVGNSLNEYTANGIDLYVKNMQAQSSLHLYGVCYVLR